jgi:hypothetical protein
MKITLVPSEHIESVWPKVQSYMERAAKYTYGRYTAEDIKSELFTKDQQLWIAFEEGDVYGAYVTEIVRYPRLKTCVIHFLGGKQFKKWGWLGLEVLQKFAKEHKCDVDQDGKRFGRMTAIKNSLHFTNYQWKNKL